MPNPVICLRDETIPNNSFQITDLFPNRSQRNPVVDPAAQGPRYLRQPENNIPVVANNAVSKAVSGLTAYLLTTIDVQAGGANPTPAQASDMAGTLLKRMRNGNELTLAKINDAIQAAGNGQDFNNTGIVGTGDSTATVQNILSILGGANFTVSAGTSVADSYLTEAQQTSAFNSNVYQAIDPSDSSFYLSVARGQLSVAKSSSTDAKGNVLYPQCVLYKADGTLL
jgi:hypothetical protein